jgi:hypothetical protein
MRRGLALLSDAFAARLGRLSVVKQATLRALLDELNQSLRSRRKPRSACRVTVLRRPC